MLLIFLCLLTSLMWKATKWVEIRFKTMTMEQNSFVKRFTSYIHHRENEDLAAEIFQGLLES
jgi:NADPH-dependent 7-cyano-7-deazaguanine reductase QueF